MLLHEEKALAVNALNINVFVIFADERPFVDAAPSFGGGGS